jgi:hypothetical protein
VSIATFRSLSMPAHIGLRGKVTNGEQTWTGLTSCSHEMIPAWCARRLTTRRGRVWSNGMDPALTFRK